VELSGLNTHLTACFASQEFIQQKLFGSKKNPAKSKIPHGFWKMFALSKPLFFWLADIASIVARSSCFAIGV